MGLGHVGHEDQRRPPEFDTIAGRDDLLGRFDDDEAEVKIWIDELYYHDDYEDKMALEVIDFMNGGRSKRRERQR